MSTGSGSRSVPPEIRGLVLSHQGWRSVCANLVGGDFDVVGRVVDDVHDELVAKARVEC
jgi:hypothetical protein